MPKEVESSTAVLIAAVAAAAAAGIAFSLGGAIALAENHPLELGLFLVLTLGLQLLSADLYGLGGEGVSAVGMLAGGFVLGPGAAMTIAVLAAVVQWIRRRGLLHRAVFDAGDLALSTGAAALVYRAVEQATGSIALRVLAAAGAGVVYKLLNTGLLCLAMSVDESVSMRTIWRERFRWARFHYVAFGPVAFAGAYAYETVGVGGLLAFAVPPALMVLSVRQYLAHTRASVDELRAANTQLAERNGDLQALLEFGAGLGSRSHDRAELVAYAETSLHALTRGRAQISSGVAAGATALVVGDAPVGSLRFERSAEFDGERWRRLADAILPQLSTALESADLVERLRKTHLATIAALSRSMEVKDYHTGGHTERVAEIAVALARRLGFAGADLEAIEVGALLHDIGKIGIPESILHKPAPLDEGEWKIMREHPVISDYILSEVDLHPAVREIARSSHERWDGDGYPDRIAGEQIPLSARIVAVADAIDAITSDRPYRVARTSAEAFHEVRVNVGKQFCPKVLEALEQVFHEEPHILSDRTPREATVRILEAVRVA